MTMLWQQLGVASCPLKKPLPYKIPKTTLTDKLKGRYPVKPVPKTALTQDDEEKLAKWIVDCGRRGRGKTREEVCLQVSKGLCLTVVIELNNVQRKT